jgi:SOS-response transcriptional repressor LexA
VSASQRAIGQRLKAVRQKVGYSLDEASKVVKRSFAHYAKMESGNTGFSEDVIERFCQAFCDAPDFLRQYLLHGGPMPTVRPPELAKPTGELKGAREVSPVYSSELKPVPVLGFAQAAGYAPAVEPLHDFLSAFAEEQHLWAEAKPGWFTLRVEGDSMSPELPDGTLLLVAGGEFPQRGDTVVAKLRDDQVVVKEYRRHQNVIQLKALNPSGQSFEWHCKEEPDYATWMFPVRRAEIDLRRRRHEREGDSG